MTTPLDPLPPDADSPAGDPLAADRDAPRLGVHVVSETMFCPRAGLIAYETNRDGTLDDGEERDADRTPRWDWLPDYDEDLIYERLQRIWDEIWWVSRIAVWWGLATAVAFFAFDRGLGGVLAVPLAVVAAWFVRQGRAICMLERRWRAFRRAENVLRIGELGREERTVDWWQLRKAGFAVTKPREPNVQRAWRLAGRPYLILKYQGLRIPVVRKHRGRRDVHSQNRARIAAYCALLEACERAQSPFGVLLFAGSYDVVIVPHDARNRALFRQGLRQARAVVAAAEAGRPPGPPAGNQCDGCPIGFPRGHRPGRTDAHLAVLPGAYTPCRGVDGRDYHSPCGDRFEWLPPHRRVAEKRLQRT